MKAFLDLCETVLLESMNAQGRTADEIAQVKYRLQKLSFFDSIIFLCNKSHVNFENVGKKVINAKNIELIRIK